MLPLETETVERAQEAKIAGGGGHPQNQLPLAGVEYDYTRHFSVMLLGAVPVVSADEKGAYGNLTERFDMATLRSASVESHEFFLMTWSLPT